MGPDAEHLEQRRSELADEGFDLVLELGRLALAGQGPTGGRSHGRDGGELLSTLAG